MGFDDQTLGTDQ